MGVVSGKRALHSISDDRDTNPFDRPDSFELEIRGGQLNLIAISKF
ncbi:MAG: hypothetical protein Ct9H90mP25_6430 [Gammaproteobacteria bacterium]|nr:MAG: hypothetical protein Ct9H90mP25_6430 [Gammaproteobacteria bacterium]